MKHITLETIEQGIFWLEFPEADFRIVCGCPENLLKFLIQKKYIREQNINGVSCETGPDAILLMEQAFFHSDSANETEMPILQMMYLQGKSIPNHPNSKRKPLLIGTSSVLKHQLEYLDVSSYGTVKKEDYISSGISSEFIDDIFHTKNFFSFGGYKPSSNLIETREVSAEKQELCEGIFFQRLSYNIYAFEYKGETVEVDINLKEDKSRSIPYNIKDVEMPKGKFVVTNIGCGDAWNTQNPCFSSLLNYDGAYYLIDAPPNLNVFLKHLGIKADEIAGIFNTHCHDDHFSGINLVFDRAKRLPFFATPPVLACARRKFSCLFNLLDKNFEEYFDPIILTYSDWFKIRPGFEVVPLLSPHPVDTSVLYFKAEDKDKNITKTYSHMGDIIALDLLYSMVNHENPEYRISENFYEFIKIGYQYPADVKKIDIGGGMIHGNITDFIEDPTPCKILGHIHRKLNSIEKEQGKILNFGDSIVLLE